MKKNSDLAWAINYLEQSLMVIPEDMTVSEIIEWAESARDNDEWAQLQGYDDIENWAEENGVACINTAYEEPINPHLSER